MKKIISLPKNLISKIAAGEVVERPASVVKELVENSIDAGATELNIYLEQGGKKSIQVIDNGEGMDEEDVLNCFKLHTTSKIKEEADLSKINTFGFRGEALASISAISQTIIHSYAPDSQPIKIIVENGEMITREPIPRTKGTTITVKDLFRHLPARKKFLKSDVTEYHHSLFEITKVAISNPHISFKVFHNSKNVLELIAAQSVKDRILAIFKGLKSADLINFSTSATGIKIEGYILHPSKLSFDNTNQYLFLNNRFVIDRSLNHAIKGAYSTSISKDKQPGYFLSITINPASVDVNIHPRKLEVKIDNAQQLYQMLRFNIEQTLSKNLQSQLASRVASFGNHSASSALETNITYKHSPASSSSNSGIRDFSSSPKYNEINNLAKKPIKKNTISAAIDFNSILLDTSNDTFNKPNNFIQIFNTYLIIEKENKLLIIDQHAAHERINYERYIKIIEKGEGIESQKLLLPLELEIPESELEIINENQQIVTKNTGIMFERLSSNKIKILSQPTGNNSINFTALLHELAESLETYDAVTTNSFVHKLAAILACHNSIRAGRKIEAIEAQQLIIDLFKCENPYSCPHGRPIIWELSKYELETKFERKQ